MTSVAHRESRACCSPQISRRPDNVPAFWRWTSRLILAIGLASSCSTRDESRCWNGDGPCDALELERSYAQRPRVSLSLADKQAFVWPSALVDAASRPAPERQDFWTPSLSLRDVVIRFVSSGGTLSGHVVNVGAGDGCITNGLECDEANELLRWDEWR